MRLFWLSILLATLAWAAPPVQAAPIHFAIDLDVFSSSNPLIPVGAYPGAGSFTVDSAAIPSEGEVGVVLTDLVLTIGSLQISSADFSPEQPPVAVFEDGELLSLGSGLGGPSPSGLLAFFVLGDLVSLGTDDTLNASASYVVRVVPEPSLLLLAALGAGAVKGAGRRGKSIVERLRSRGSVRMSTDEILALTRKQR